MGHAELCLLVATDENGLLLTNPWRYEGFAALVRDFLKEHTVVMGRDAWFDFPFKEDRVITPWILSSNTHFHMYTKQRYPHAQPIDDIDVIHTHAPPKGIWWVLGGYSVYRSSMRFAHSVEATVVKGAKGVIDLLHLGNFTSTARCTHPYNSKMECAHYAKSESHSSIQM